MAAEAFHGLHLGHIRSRKHVLNIARRSRSCQLVFFLELSA